MTKPSQSPRTPRTTDPKAVVNDAVRRDGGKSTEDVPVPTDQVKKIEEAALDHTVDEPGS